MIRSSRLFYLALPFLLHGIAYAQPQPALAGPYCLQTKGQLVTGSELLLQEGGRFEWDLRVMATYMMGAGTWQQAGERVTLTAAAPVAPVFRVLGEAKGEEVPGGWWQVNVEAPGRGAVPGIEVRFEAASGETVDEVADSQGRARAELPASASWTRVGLRVPGGVDTWHWLPVPPEQASARNVSIALTNLAATQRAMFQRATLRIGPDGLAIEEGWSEVTGTYVKASAAQLASKAAGKPACTSDE